MSCNHAKQVGYVSNQDGYDRTRNHASVTTCERDSCIEAAKAWVLKKTGETGTLHPFNRGAA